MASSLANLQAIEVNIVNGPDIETDGFDFGGSYRFPAGRCDMEIRVSGTHILSFDIDSWSLGALIIVVGKPVSSLGTTRPVSSTYRR